MSHTAYSADVAPFQLAKKAEEELYSEPNYVGCQVCRNLLLADPEEVRTTYAELQGTAADGCKLCELLLQVSETVCIDLDTPVQDSRWINVDAQLEGWVEKSGSHVTIAWPGEGGMYSYFCRFIFFSLLLLIRQASLRVFFIFFQVRKHCTRKPLQ